MPSTRRFRGFAFLGVVVFLAFLYFSGSTRHSDRSFYDRSVAAMERNRAKGADDSGPPVGGDSSPSPRIPPPAPDSEQAPHAHISVEEEDDEHEDEEILPVGRMPPQVAIGEDSDSKRVKGADRWSTGKEEGKPNAKEEKTQEELEVEAELNSILKRSPIIIFSKSYCPFSKKAKMIFSLYSITPAPFIVELDQHKLGPQLQAQLVKLTGRRTVPNVLISGKSIGGGDEVAMFHEKGELSETVKSMGGKRIQEARLKGVKEKN